MRKHIIILTLFSFQVFLFSTCGKKDDENSMPPVTIIGADLPDTLAYDRSVVSDSTYILRTDINGDNDETAPLNSSITQTLATSMSPQGREGRAFKSLVVESSQGVKFTASDNNSFFAQDIDATYVINNDEYTFTIPPDNRTIKGYLNSDKTEISIPFWALRKKGAGTNATAHYPLDYETFFTTSFFQGDSLVYIQYNVIYKLSE